ncbi:MAG: hypothetical protein LBD92_07350 [Oscillospiraceae bacterium]|jgi:hypothetical protein|nr:hypothetical protein [Oscillospiraceae bacterium]
MSSATATTQRDAAVRVFESELDERAAIERAVAYYRSNIHRFVTEYLKIPLDLSQKINLFMMDMANNFCWIASRGAGKTFLAALFCFSRCVLYPGTKICVVSGKREQAQFVLEKIKTELYPMSEAVRRELGDIKNVKITTNKAICVFPNSSYIKVVTAADSARGNRANILVVDEFRLVDKDTLDTVLKYFLVVPRMPGYTGKPEYKNYTEMNKQIFISSGWYAEHWSYKKFMATFVNMLGKDMQHIAIGSPYQLAIKEGRLKREQAEDMALSDDFNEIKWLMEMDALFWGNETGTFFEYNVLAGARSIKFPMLPGKVSVRFAGGERYMRIPNKKPGEKRLISLDIALMSSKKHNNDASSLFINQLVPTSDGRYLNNFVYSESFEGAHTADQALLVRRYYQEYDCDYIVIDARGVGAGVVDLLVRDIVDPETEEVYSALSCCNNDEWAARCATPGASKAIFAVTAGAQFNSECAVMLREGFRTGRVRLLASEYDCEKSLSELNGWNTLTESDRLKVRMQYINTTLLINELISLEHDESGGRVQIFNRRARKDRYSSVSSSYYAGRWLETKLLKPKGDVASMMNSIFTYKAPVLRNEGGGFNSWKGR